MATKGFVNHTSSSALTLEVKADNKIKNSLELRMRKTTNETDKLVRSGLKRRSFRNKPIKPEEVRAKVIEDIHFLRDRIDHIKHATYSQPNPILIETYECMLESREAVLNWLQSKEGDSAPKFV